MYAVGFIGTASSWLLMNRFGRRDIYFWGQVVLVSFMLITGILGTVDRESAAAQWAIGVLCAIRSWPRLDLLGFDQRQWFWPGTCVSTWPRRSMRRLTDRQTTLAE
jgi:hypothetical protein